MSTLDCDCSSGVFPFLIVRCGTYRQMDIVRHNLWSGRVEVTEQILHAEVDGQENVSQLSALNLAHNAFTRIPPALPCLAVNLTRLNLAYNR